MRAMSGSLKGTTTKSKGAAVSKAFAICIGDTHFPFACRKTLKTIYRAIHKFKPYFVIQMGDLKDQFSAAKWPRSYSVITPEDEFKRARVMAETFWANIASASPGSKRYQLKGNHDDRAKKRILERLPDLEPLLRLDEIYRFDGVTTMADEREGLILEDILFMHGFRATLGDHAKHAHRSVVCGHSHLGGAVFMRDGDKTIFELNAGHCADTATKPLSYSRQRYIAKTTKGYGLLQIFGKNIAPTFIPLPN